MGLFLAPSESLAVALLFLSLLKWSGGVIKTWAARVGPNGKIDELVCAVRLEGVYLANGCTRFTYIFNVLNYELNFVLHYLFLKRVVSCYALIFHVVFSFENFQLLSQRFAILSTFKKTSCVQFGISGGEQFFLIKKKRSKFEDSLRASPKEMAKYAN